jgi:phage tail-like protein
MPSGGGGSSTGQKPPLTAARFAIRIEGSAKPAAVFTELGGISSEVEIVEYLATDSVSGAVSHTKQYGKTKPPTITLKRGVDGDASLWAWHQMVLAGDPMAKMSCTLELIGVDGKPKVTYWLSGAWPAKLDISGIKAGATEVVVETVTFTCEEIKQMPPSGG